jgi:hypothetical protein
VQKLILAGLQNTQLVRLLKTQSIITGNYPEKTNAGFEQFPD